jgi:uncharacterized protein YndB with AHSA1/START domain
VIEFEVETQIARPVGEVFAYVTDPARLPTWQTNTVSVEQLDEGPLRPGSRLREVHRAPGGRELASVVEVAELEPGRTLALRVLEGLPIDARISFEPVREGTIVRFFAHGQPTGAARLLQPLVRAALKRQFSRDCKTLKGLLELP